MGFLHRLRVAPDWIEVDKFSMIFSFFLSPDNLHRFDLLSQDFPAFLERSAVVLHLLSVPAAANAKDQATVGELIDGRYLLGHGDRVTFDRQADAAAKLDRFGGCRRRSKRHKKVMRVPILFGQVPASRIRAPPA